MPSKPSVLITGALGGIGRALCEEFHAHGFAVIALDRREGEVACHRYINADIGVLATDIKAREAFTAGIRSVLQEENMPLKGLVNNAAVQILGGVDELTVEAWQETLATNLLAPFFLVQALLPELEEARGAVVNISSIHEKLTKAGFVAYSTSKTALSGLTRAMAVDLGSRVKVNAICPAAIKTHMLSSSFEGRPEAFDALHQAHPSGRIGLPEEVAHLARYLIAEAPDFLNGSCLGLDGGIAGRLHDPA
jgi:NAD(P)-dependent dehydrogenase (short-subunit alcohol dehydrogenase family)